MIIIPRQSPTRRLTELRVGLRTKDGESLYPRQFLAAATASAVASGLFNPLDSLRVRWQVQPHSVNITILQFGQNILEKEGLIHGLWRPGLAANISGMAIASGIRFGNYEYVRNAMGSDKKTWHMAVAGLLCGGVAYAVTTPLHLIKTRLQGQAPSNSSTWRALVQVVHSSGRLTSLYQGWLPLAFRGSLFTAGQFVGYDGLKTFVKSHNSMQDGPFLHALASISASFCASFCSAPADYVMTRYMNGHSTDLLECMLTIYREGGLVSFWRGWSVAFVRLTPVLFTYSAVYEQLRLQFGLGYLD
jgi:dicarboxylate transporter 10